MNEKIYSNVTQRFYNPSHAVRLVNIRQICTYLKMGLSPLDIYASIDFKTNNPVLVVLFDRTETHDAYQRWCESENLWEELQNENTCTVGGTTT